MLLKYVVDASAIKINSGVTWTPWDYLLPSFALHGDKLDRISPALSVALLLWTLLFVWVGVSMTLRRAIDAGRSPWLALWFFIPVVNYVLMLYLASAPSALRPLVATADHPVVHAGIKSALAGVLGGTLIAFIGFGLLVFRLGSYGAPLFLGVPVMVGSFSGYVFNRRALQSGKATDSVILLSLLMIGGAIILFALEGAICLVMALPLAIPLGILGGRVGRRIAQMEGAPPIASAAVMLFLPASFLAERATQPTLPPTYEVVTAITVAAPPSVVWEKVVQFKEIPAPSEWYFRAGIAYPIRATIDGFGVGAIRRCVFSTGDFVEPIAVWDVNHRLAFGVTAQPAPLRELSPYAKVYAPHLNGFFVSERGEFRLIAIADGGTRLEGHTWYHNNMYPQAYWRMYSDPILHRIHARVLDQVEREAESALTLKAAR